VRQCLSRSASRPQRTLQPGGVTVITAEIVDGLCLLLSAGAVLLDMQARELEVSENLTSDKRRIAAPPRI